MTMTDSRRGALTFFAAQDVTSSCGLLSPADGTVTRSCLTAEGFSPSRPKVAVIPAKLQVGNEATLLATIGKVAVQLVEVGRIEPHGFGSANPGADVAGPGADVAGPGLDVAGPGADVAVSSSNRLRVSRSFLRSASGVTPCLTSEMGCLPCADLVMFIRPCFFACLLDKTVTCRHEACSKGCRHNWDASSGIYGYSRC